MHSYWLISATAELTELAALLRWRQDQMGQGSDGVRGPSLWDELMGEDQNDVVDPDGNNDSN